MKKLLALILVLTLVLSMGSLAFATPDPEPPELGAEDDWSPIKINKELDVQGLNPSETFNFKIGEGSGLRDNVAITAPDFDPTIFSITVAQGAEDGSANIDLPTFTQVGVYTYPITETAGDTAGFDYDGGEYNLVVTVINNPNYVEGQTAKFLRVLTLTDGNNVKRDAFKNSFDSGDLIINKEITGNYALFDDEFDVTVVLTPPADKVIKEGPIAVSGAVGGIGNVAAPNDKGEVIITFKVTHNSTVTIANIPYGVSYEVSEDSGEYEATISGSTGTIGAASHEVKIVNTLDTDINTGINLDNLPYILILVGAAVGLVAFTMKRRLSDDR